MSTDSDKQPEQAKEQSALNKEIERWKKDAEHDKAQLDQAMEILRREQADKKKREDMEKAVIVTKICQDWAGVSGVRRAVTSPKFSFRLLKQFDNILEQYKSREFDKYHKEMIAEDTAKPFDRHLTVGEYDQERKEWKK